MDSAVSAFSVYKKSKAKLKSQSIKTVHQKKSKHRKKKSLGVNVKNHLIKIVKQRDDEFVDNGNSKRVDHTVVPSDKLANRKELKKTKVKLKETTPSFNSKLKNDNILHTTDPTVESLKLFKWLIAPLSPSKFFEKYWEVQALHIQHNSTSYYNDILTTERLDRIFREHPLYYTKNVDVVSYENGVKQVHNEEGKVTASALYDYYLNGCSIRVLNPQTYDQKVHLLLSTLQEYFGTMVGANIYLTPPNSQGFAPHYDDIEAFVIQLEGRKHWKLYKPRGCDVLARESSPNLKHEDIGEPFMSVTLNAGDLLYFPRGTIHEGSTDKDCHSFHITVSVYQHNSYADLLEYALPTALKKAALENLEFRKGLPLNYLKHTGLVNRSNKSEERRSITATTKRLVSLLTDYIDVDQAADQLGRRFMYDSMPPVLSKQEMCCSSKYDGDSMKCGKILNRAEIDLDTEVRLLRYYCLRLVSDQEGSKLYYNTENAKVYHGEEEQFLSIDTFLIPCVEKLQREYPKFLKVEDLVMNNDYSTVTAQLVSDLWERGLLVTNGSLSTEIDD